MFTFSLPTTALFSAGKLNDLHTRINTPTAKRPSDRLT